MASFDFYDTGTVTVTSGSATVTGAGTLWTGLVIPGDVLEVAGLMVRILAVVSDTEVTLVKPWPGDTAAGADYSVTYASPSRSDGTYVAERVRELITRQTILDRGTAIFAVAGVGTDAPPGAPVEGDAYVIGAAPTGAWVGYVGHLATWSGTAWIFTAPEVGMQVQDTSVDPPIAYVRGAASWVVRAFAGITTGTLLGELRTSAAQGWLRLVPDDDDAQRIELVARTGGTGALWAGGDFITWDRSGRVRHASQPRFFARYAAIGVVSGAGPLVLDEALINVGTHYSTATGRFTAPVAGTYLVCANGQSDGSVTTANHVSLYKNGAWVRGFRMEWHSSSGYSTRSMSGLVDLAQGDYINLQNTQGNNVLKDGFSFSGMLIA